VKKQKRKFKYRYRYFFQTFLQNEEQKKIVNFLQKVTVFAFKKGKKVLFSTLIF